MRTNHKINIRNFSPIQNVDTFLVKLSLTFLGDQNDLRRNMIKSYRNLKISNRIILLALRLEPTNIPSLILQVVGSFLIKENTEVTTTDRIKLSFLTRKILETDARVLDSKILINSIHKNILLNLF